LQQQSSFKSLSLEDKVRNIKRRIAELEQRIGRRSHSEESDQHSAKTNTANLSQSNHNDVAHDSLRNQRANELHNLKKKLQSKV